MTAIKKLLYNQLPLKSPVTLKDVVNMAAIKPLLEVQTFDQYLYCFEILLFEIEIG